MFPFHPARMLGALVPACALVAGLACGAQPAAAQPARHVTAEQGGPGGRSLLIESRLTGLHLDAFVDGFRQPGMIAPQGAVAPAFDFAAAPFAGLTAEGPWSPLPPPARWVHSTIYDPVRDRLIVFGGQGYSGSTNEVWALSLSGIPRWSMLLTSGTTPSARAFHSAAYDSLLDRMIVFGGNDGSPRNDVWALSFAGSPTWSQLDPTGTPPSPRAWHAAVVDRARNRMIVHGGQVNGTGLADTWALSLGATPAWTPLAAAGAGPGVRSAHAVALDAPGDRLIVFAGIDAAGQATATAWTLSLGGTPTWAALTPTGTPPGARYGASGTYDRLRRRAIFFGGGVGAPNTNETWALTLEGTPAWTLLPSSNAPQGRQFHTAAYDPFGDRLLVYGGSSGPVLSDTWALPLSSPGSAWIPLSGTRRKGHTAVLDTARRRMVIFGGENSSQLNDLWELGLGAGSTWARLNPAGTPPSARALHTAIYDDRRDRMMVFGGRGGPPTNDLWELTLSGSLEWRLVEAAGTPPPPRFDHVAVLDASRYRILVFGGMDAGGSFNDAWALSLAGTPTWSLLATTGNRPSARGGAQAIFDTVRDRIVVFGGYTQNFTPLGDVWQLSFTNGSVWSALTPSGTAPVPRFAGATSYDTTRDRMLVASGTDFVNFHDETWALQFAGFGTSASWSRLSGPGQRPTSRSDHKSVYDVDSDRLVSFGGFNLNGVLHDTWEMDFTAVVGVPDGDMPTAGAGPLTLALTGANPARDAARFQCSLPTSGPIALELVDARGRAVRTVAAGSFAAGRHAFAWDGRDMAGRRAAAGIYFARVRQGDAEARTRVVWLP